MNAQVFLVVAVLELFCGTKSVGRTFEAGWEFLLSRSQGRAP